MKGITAVLCGNPNVGKSTVFNGLTGLRQHTGNWAGKTVESAKGTVGHGEGEWTLIDLPGAYSLISGSPDELAASDYLLLGDYDAAIVVCDATCLARSLVLALQTARLTRKTVVCINLVDEAKRHGLMIDPNKLSAMLGMPVVCACARSGQGLSELAEAAYQTAVMKEDAGGTCATMQRMPAEVQTVLDPLEEALAAVVPEASKREILALRLLCADRDQRKALIAACDPSKSVSLYAALEASACRLKTSGFKTEEICEMLLSSDHALAEAAASVCIRQNQTAANTKRLRQADRILCSPITGIPLMLLLLVLLFYITLVGANAPSAWLSSLLMGFEQVLAGWLTALHLPPWAVAAVAHGMYRSLAWVVAVMLPPMAIFFPLFTLLEDLGYLPRIAFNMDRCFRGCKACGKQALCMCMGLGCNAVGVTGCRIIRSPRERLLAILTNALIPCNGRLPLILLLITLVFQAAGYTADPLLAAVILAAFLMLSVLLALLICRILSATALKGMSSTFVLELPPLRMPKVGQVLVRSMLDRTIFVLMRAVAVAAPAGLLLWILGNVQICGIPVLAHAAGWLDPFGRLLGMDGVILLAFILGLPANEIVLPIMLMIYLRQGSLTEAANVQVVSQILAQNGWTWLTAACTALFALFHWPCSTTLLTIRKETGSLRWTALAMWIPTAAGFCLCAALAGLARLLGAA